MSKDVNLVEILNDLQFSVRKVRLGDINLPKDIPASFKDNFLQPSTKQIRCWQGSELMGAFSRIVSPMLICPLSANSQKFIVLGNLSTYALLRSHFPQDSEVLVLLTKARVKPEAQIELIRLDILYSKLILAEFPVYGLNSFLDEIFDHAGDGKIFTNPAFQRVFPKLTSRKRLSHQFVIANRRAC